MKKLVLGTCAVLAAISGSLIVISPSAESAGAMVCGQRDALINYLDTKYQQSRMAYGLTGGEDRIAELFISPRGSWTLVITSVNGTSCLLVSGNGWESIPTNWPEA